MKQTKQIYYTIQQYKLIMQSRKGWSEIEDDRLLKIIKKYGIKNWTLISQKLSLGGIQERTGKQCRQRWHNNLNPSISNKEWTSKDDQVLFQAHSKYGSKWKQISKLFEGRTDNSIKNHFYSTVRSCLRRISHSTGERHSAGFMKSIKPFVLSKIVQNAELTKLIVNLGRNKSKSSSKELDMDQTTVLHINKQLKRISQQYEQQQNKKISHSANQHSSSHSIASQSSHSKPEKDKHDQIVQQGRLIPQNTALQFYVEEDSFIQNGHELVEQTQQEQKRSFQPYFQTKFRCFEEQFQKQTAQKQQKEELVLQEQIWLQQEESPNFFHSPSYKKNTIPYLRLHSKISKNSQSEGCLDVQEKNKRILQRQRQQEEQIEIEYDPEELLNSD